MQKLTFIIRIFAGFILVLFGLNGFLGFMPMPEMPASAGAFMGALAAAGYLMPLVMLIEILVGAALLANRWVPLALTVLAPVLVNIIGFHLFLDPAGLAPGILLTAMTLFLAWQHRDLYRGVLSQSRTRAISEVQNTELAAAA